MKKYKICNLCRALGKVANCKECYKVNGNPTVEGPQVNRDSINKGGVMLAISIIVFLIMYFLPSLIAFGRWHNNFSAIFATNLMFGWTVIGWCAAIIWALTDNVRSE